MARADRRLTRLLRCYPPSWRQRYGEELRVLVEDTYGDEQMPLHDQLSIVRAGLHERVRASGLAGTDDPAGQVRSGALLVLCAWSVLVVGGCAFAKFAEHWDAATPAGSRAVPAAAYAAVVVGAVVGATLIVVAAATVLPAFVQLLREGEWQSIRRPVGRAIVVSAVAAVATAGLVAWAHHLGSATRNTTIWPYGFVVLVWGGLLMASIGCCTAAVVATTRRLDLSDRRLRALGSLALLALLPLGVVALATFLWWYAVAASTPSFFAGAGLGSTGSPFAPMIAGAGLLMLVALAIAASGAGRLRTSLRQLDHA